MFPDLDRGMQWCEDRLLAGSGHEDRPVGAVWGWVDDAHRERLMAHLERLDLPAGQPLIRQGECLDDLYFLESGRLTVELTPDAGAPMRLRAVTAGAVVGELGLYLRSPRTATVVSECRCIVYRLSRRALEDMERTDPELAAAIHRRLAALLARRLADSNRTLAALLD
jgi:SulP family sulfate permease